VLDPQSFGNVADRRLPTPTTNGFIVAGWAFFTAVLAVWWLVIHVFRRHRIEDTSPSHEHFFEWWLRRIFLLRRLSLFALTIGFMPVARVILSQFECYCPASSRTGGTSSLPPALDGHAPLVTAAGYATFEDLTARGGWALAANTTTTTLSCYIRTFPSQACFPTEVTVLQVSELGAALRAVTEHGAPLVCTQIAAIVFAFVYIVGIPVFFYTLINRGIHQVPRVPLPECALLARAAPPADGGHPRLRRRRAAR
jgi:hypothetical protein